MRNKFAFILFFACTFSLGLKGQENFYQLNQIQEIRIYFEQNNWDHILDSLFIAGEKDRLLCNIEINGEALDSVGIRYKGFSSVSTDRIKNPFNIKLDYVKRNQVYDGIDKIKLSNVIQDPSFLREVLSYQIGRKYMPSSGANFANVYINDELWGLYTNVEAINKDFIEKHFGNRGNSFFKCNPETLNLNGENSNLSNTPGVDSSDYYALYDIESDYGWTELYDFINVLNEEVQNIEEILNIDRALWMHAFNYALINFDSYVGYAQNYYLYRDDNGQFNPILWDLNQSFGSYRLADASEHFDGFSIQEAKNMDPLLHYNSVSVYPRPLMRNLFENDRYRKMYLAHLRTIMDGLFENQFLENSAQEIQDLITTAVLDDPNKFYSDQDFFDNKDVTVTDLVDYPGILDLMNERHDFLNNYPGFLDGPEIMSQSYSPQNVNLGDDVFINAQIDNATKVFLSYRFGGQGLFITEEMVDDGSMNDEMANDGIYGFQINNISHSMEYYIYAENESAGKFSPEDAAYKFHSFQAHIEPQTIVVNEFMAFNTNAVLDNAGEIEDWIEIYNRQNYDLSLAGLYLSDDRDNLQKWAFPNEVIAAEGYQVVWADEDASQGAMHANFKLNSEGEQIYISDFNGVIIDSVEYTIQQENISTGRLPNGEGDFLQMPATPNAENIEVSDLNNVLKESIFIYPNPANNEIYIVSEESTKGVVELVTIDGRVVTTQWVEGPLVKMDCTHLSNGIYIARIIVDGFLFNQKVVVKK